MFLTGCVYLSACLAALTVSFNPDKIVQGPSHYAFSLKEASFMRTICMILAKFESKSPDSFLAGAVD